ncbi:mobilization protein [Aliivibrio fischeri]|uniref:MobC family replication-relaxation protein n=1 Tax=Aliivibrio fischeri TaxID=668 RepID=UPI0012DA5881|nr:MobC family replication-relaxation protein [Aliivibrio fischeri]MUJ27954.1 mobilization protein [Aliivibrio fischeri]
MIITDPTKRFQRNVEKQNTVLQFLKQETYSDFSNLKLLLNYKNRAPLDRLLNKLLDQDLVVKHISNYHQFKISLWGITAQGLNQCVEFTENASPPYFQPSKVKTWTMLHHLMNQEVRIYLERKGWTDWQNGDRHSFKKKYPVAHRPDAVILAPNGYPIAIETERNIKTAKRYQEVIKSHLLAKKAKYWEKVIYVVPDKKTQHTIKNHFNAITYVTINNTRVTLTEEHRRVFDVFTLDEIKTLRIG